MNTNSVITRRPYLIVHFELTVPVTVIPVRYIANALLLSSVFGIKNHRLANLFYILKRSSLEGLGTSRLVWNIL
jgi:hypothetical protein